MDVEEFQLPDKLHRIDGPAFLGRDKVTGFVVKAGAIIPRKEADLFGCAGLKVRQIEPCACVSARDKASGFKRGSGTRC